jgi:hypothetical protein
MFCEGCDNLWTRPSHLESSTSAGYSVDNIHCNQEMPCVSNGQYIMATIQLTRFIEKLFVKKNYICGHDLLDHHVRSTVHK